MEATTTSAWTVMRSMPTSETRNHASITMPLSRTRSKASTWPLVGIVLSTITRTLHGGPRDNLPLVGKPVATRERRSFARLKFVMGKTFPKVGRLQGHQDTVV